MKTFSLINLVLNSFRKHKNALFSSSIRQFIIYLIMNFEKTEISIN